MYHNPAALLQQLICGCVWSQQLGCAFETKQVVAPVRKARLCVSPELRLMHVTGCCNFLCGEDMLSICVGVRIWPCLMYSVSSNHSVPVTS